MDRRYFEGKEAFLEDYKQVIKEPTIDQEQVLDEVIEQLNQPIPDDHIDYVLPAEKTLTGHSVRFPFRKTLIANDLEATVSKQFIYEGSPVEFEAVDEEQV